MKRSLLLFALCACAFGAQAGVYKWIDEAGKVQYGDAPPKNAKAKVVSGGVTVVPATAIPTPPAPKAKPEGEPGDEAARAGRSGSAGLKPSSAEAKRDDGAAPISAQPDPGAAAREAATRARAIERCKASRGVDCENEVDAQLYGRPAPTAVPMPGYAPGALPGWSQPPIRPARQQDPIDRRRESGSRPITRPIQKPESRPPQPEVKEMAPPPAARKDQSQSSAIIKPMR